MSLAINKTSESINSLVFDPTEARVGRPNSKKHKHSDTEALSTSRYHHAYCKIGLSKKSSWHSESAASRLLFGDRLFRCDRLCCWCRCWCCSHETGCGRRSCICRRHGICRGGSCIGHRSCHSSGGRSCIGHWSCHGSGGRSCVGHGSRRRQGRSAIGRSSISGCTIG